ncbi:HupE/UreJ family protein [Croceibacterium aestuarii]|uniref:HupE/UreJ family protein n=1 Tax=Croceibacterium aestuarii TaxID=3064139 RepID=UPI00272E74C9|nr:HupE/UreJ family protein [Croceibacterium sp. D39]
MLRLVLALLALLAAGQAQAHPAPFSYLDVRYDPERGIVGTLTVHDFDIAHDLELTDPAQLQDPHLLIHMMDDIGPMLAKRFVLAADGRPLDLAWEYAEPLAGQNAVRLWFRATGPPGGKLTYSGEMFHYDPQHQTFVNIYDGGKLVDQWIVGTGGGTRTYYRGNTAGAVQVLKTFVPAGAHHIWIGPDHLLFLLGLLLFGGTWRKLVGIVTAFTIGHSVTLTLAALDIWSPPSWLVEPMIALTIIVVGADNLMRGEGKDLRIWLAGTFGLIHGFGFAAVLREFGLPQAALGWSLFGFNLGVELGQLALVIPLALALGWLWRHRPRNARQLATAGSVVVVAAGVYWFVQRTFLMGGT